VGQVFNLPDFLNAIQRANQAKRVSRQVTNLPHGRVEMWRGGLGVGLVCCRPFRLPVP